jgi:hypothetical protein
MFGAIGFESEESKLHKLRERLRLILKGCHRLDCLWTPSRGRSSFLGAVKVIAAL